MHDAIRRSFRKPVYPHRSVNVVIADGSKQAIATKQLATSPFHYNLCWLVGRHSTMRSISMPTDKMPMFLFLSFFYSSLTRRTFF